ncbi:MAG: ABC transporter permease subunit [Gammaproteobacteria bacterium]
MPEISEPIKNLIHTFSEGLFCTLALFFSVLATALLIAIICTFIRALKIRVFQPLLYLYLLIIRGSPLLVQLFLIYYGLGQIDFLKESELIWNIFKEPAVTAWLALSLNSGAYTTLLFTETLEKIEIGQSEAALSLGLSRFQNLRYILFPQTWKLSLGAYSNEVLFILKATALASTISVMDLTGVTRQLIAQTYDPSYFLITALIYLLLNALILQFFKQFWKNQSKSTIA